MHGIMDTLGLICIVFLTVLRPAHSICNTGEAQRCMGRQSTPSDGSDTQCNAALNTLRETVECVDTNLADCSDSQKSPIIASLTTIQTAISTRCGKSGCPALGTQWTPYQKCMRRTSKPLTQLLVDIRNKFNTNSFAPKNDATCIEVKTLSACLKLESKDCDYLRKEYGKLYTSASGDVHFKQIQDICGVETEPTDTQGPIVAPCNELESDVLQKIQTKCPFNFDYSDSSLTVVHACRDMQTQIDCILEFQDSCPQAVTKFLTPRLGAYLLPNMIFCDNMTMNGVKVRAIQREDATCDFTAVFNCFYSLMRSFGTTFSEVNNNSILKFLKWNVATSKSECDAFRNYNATSTAMCLDIFLQYCPMPSPTFGVKSATDLLGDNTRYQPALYDILKTGPTPINQYGARFLADRRNFICYDDCANVQTLSQQLSSTCGPTIKSRAQTVSNSVTPDCVQFNTSLACAVDTSRSCPLLYNDVMDILNDADVRSALIKCKATDLELYPEDYFTTVTTTTPWPTTSIFTFKTTTYITPSATFPPGDPAKTTKSSETTNPSGPTSATTQPPVTTTEGSKTSAATQPPTTKMFGSRPSAANKMSPGHAVASFVLLSILNCIFK